MKIAFIDDDKAYHALLEALLIHRSPFPNTLTCFYEVSEFIPGDYDVVLTDLQMKETQGRETIEAIQAKTDIPIIIMSGIGGDKRRASDGLRYLELGVLDMLPKAEVTDPNFAQNIKDIVEQGATFKHVKVTKTETIDVIDSDGLNYEQVKKLVAEG